MSDLPDFFSPFVLKLWDGSQFVTALGLPSGEFYAMLKCKYNSTIKDVLGDQSGNLTLNIKAQDLAELINRPKYGAAHAEGADVTLSPHQTYTLYNISGKGIVYGGAVWTPNPPVPTGVNQADSTVTVLADGEGLNATRFAHLNTLGLLVPTSMVTYLTAYDTTNHIYAVAITPGITFETSLKVLYIENNGQAPSVGATLLYALL